MTSVSCAAVLALAACGGRTDLDLPVAGDTEADADAGTGTGTEADTGADTEAAAELDAPKGCSATLSVGTVNMTPGCWIDQKVSDQTVVLAWACDGGAAEANFGVPFVGTVDESTGSVSLTATTTFPWCDGCTWQSKQTIEGTLQSGALEYAYSEMHIQGTNCAPEICHGWAVVSVTQ